MSQPELLTPEQAQTTLRWLMRQTWRVLLKGLKDDFKKSGDPIFTPNLRKNSLNGYCGFAQSFVDLTVADYNIGVSRPFAIQSVPCEDFGHVALTLELQTTEGAKTYLIDPTFKQFCIDVKHAPGNVLKGLPDGEHICRELVEKGYTELTPTCATSYLSAFFYGVAPFSCDEASLHFFAEPPRSPWNKWFSRAQLASKNYIKPKV